MGAEAGDTCATCQHFAPLSPGHAAICFAKWRDLPWNAAVPLTRAADWCEQYEAKIASPDPEPGR